MNSFVSQQHAAALPKSNLFYPENFNAMQIVKVRLPSPSNDKKNMISSFPCCSDCNSIRQACEWVTPRVSHLPVKSHLLAWSLFHSSLGSQPFSTWYPYLSLWSPPGKAKTGCFRPWRLLQSDVNSPFMKQEHLLATKSLFYLILFYFPMLYKILFFSIWA